MTSHMACLTTAKRRFYSTSLVQIPVSMTTALTPPSDHLPRPRWGMDQSAVMPVISLVRPPPHTSLMSVLTLRLMVGFQMEEALSLTPSMINRREQMKVNVHWSCIMYMALALCVCVCMCTNMCACTHVCVCVCVLV